MILMMRLLALCNYQLIYLLFVFQTDASPTNSPLDTTNITALNLPDSTGLECFPAKFRGSRRAATGDCLLAVLQLPKEHDPGHFHRGGPNDIFRLPLPSRSGGCTVTVDLVNDPKDGGDYTSWTNIIAVCGAMINACAVGYFPGGYTGGTIQTGSAEKIRITAGRIRNPSDLSSMLCGDGGIQSA